MRCRRPEWSLWRRLLQCNILQAPSEAFAASGSTCCAGRPSSARAGLVLHASVPVRKQALQLQVAKVKLPTQPVAVCVNHNSSSEVLVSMKEGPPILVDLATGTRREVPCVPSGQHSALRTSRCTACPPPYEGHDNALSMEAAAYIIIISPTSPELASLIGLEYAPLLSQWTVTMSSADSTHMRRAAYSLCKGF